MHNDMFSPEKINPQEASVVVEEVSKIVTISKYVGNVIRDLYPQAASKLRAIYSGVDYNRFLPGKHPKMQNIRNQIRKEHGLENKTVILFSGRLSYNKGVDLLVRALPALSKKFKDLALVIVGSKWFSQNEITDYIAYVKALTRKSPVPVIATGFVSPSEIQKWYGAADLFVCTSIWQEPLARVHYEAMAAGLPIVTTARGGNAEVILLGENGLIVENPENPAEFEEKITEVLSNKGLMEKMGQKGREIAVSLYNWERVASEVLEVWNQSEHISIDRAPQENGAAMVEDHDNYELASTNNGAELENEIEAIDGNKDKDQSEQNNKDKYKSKVRSEKEVLSDRDKSNSKKNKDKYKSKSRKDVISDAVKSILNDKDLFKSADLSRQDVLGYMDKSDHNDKDPFKSKRPSRKYVLRPTDQYLSMIHSRKNL
jgi:spore coat protein SA